MIGFPKTEADFASKFCAVSALKRVHPKLWQALQSQKRFYLDNKDFSAQKKKDWRYFPLKSLLSQEILFGEKAPNAPSPSAKAPFSKAPLPVLPTGRVIWIQDGRPANLPLNNDELFACSWSEFLRSPPKGLSPDITDKILKSLKSARDPFCALSNALFPEGFVLVIKKKLSYPLEIHYTQSPPLPQDQAMPSSAEGAPLPQDQAMPSSAEGASLPQDQAMPSSAEGAQNPPPCLGFNLRNFIFLEQRASARALEIFHAKPAGAPALFLNLQTDVFANESSVLEHIRIDQSSRQSALISQLFASLEPKAKAGFFILSLQAHRARWNCVVQQEKDSQSDIKGLSLLGGDQYSDHKVSVRHKGPGGKSSQMYRSFLFDSARQIFQGFISMDKEAQKCSARQMSKNFLFGEKASAVACPELDIKADDVKASHGAALSPYAENKELLFYLQSRGVAQKEAFYLFLSSLLAESLAGLEDDSSKKLIRSLCYEKLKKLYI